MIETKWFGYMTPESQSWLVEHAPACSWFQILCLRISMWIVPTAHAGRYLEIEEWRNHEKAKASYP